MANDGEIERAIDALYQGPQAAFIAARNALAKRLNADGDADRAAAIKQMAKPSVSAWAVNQLWWHDPVGVQALRDAGEQVRAATSRSAGPAGQAAARKARRAALTELSVTAARLLTDGGHACATGTMRKISASLEAIAAYGQADVSPPLGRFNAELAAPGFATLAALGGIGAPVARDGSPHDSSSPDGSPHGLRLVPSASPSAPAAPAPSPVAEASQRAIQDAEAALAAAQSASDAAAMTVDTYAKTADEAALKCQGHTAAHRDAQAQHKRTALLVQEAEAALLHATRIAGDASAALAGAQAALKAHHEALAAARAALTRARGRWSR